MINVYTRGAAFHIGVQGTIEEVEEALQKAEFDGDEFVEFEDFRGLRVKVRERSVDAFWVANEGQEPVETTDEANTERDS